ncbi:unnamed protein product [Mytilus edulis]|uniref:Ig-like domain-containing protein n=1 Tax=Mytilus edulis TaxID=6550 RepID=A0A8S3V006_MYTED|nr:unnamed protein product [Mytilus edulis]
MQIVNVTAKEEEIFECSQENSFEVKSITLVIQDATVLLFKNDNPITTVEGRNITIVRSCDINPSAAVIIEKDGLPIDTHCTISSCSHTFSNIRRNDDGLYMCNKYNNHSIEQARVIINVRYPPVIRIIKNVTNNFLTCELEGMPQSDTYRRRQHLSEYGQIIRWLPKIKPFESPSGVNIDF